MPVGSIIDLYTTVLAWYMYNATWSVLVGTGLVMLPFIVAVIRTIAEDSEKERKQTKQYVRTLEFRIYILFIVMLACAQPMITLHTDNMVYTHITCTIQNEGSDTLMRRYAERIDYGNSGTNTDDVAVRRFNTTLNNRESAVPLWWYMAGRLTHALTLSMKFELPCNPQFSNLVEGLSALRIEDDLLRSEVQQFHRDCWREANGKYMRERRDRNFTLPPSLRSDADAELNWIGSRIFINLDGYYNFFRATEPVTDFFWVESRDGAITDQYYSGDRGFPFCDEWWEPEMSTLDGLRTRLLHYIKSQEAFEDQLDGYGGVWEWFSSLFSGTDSQRRRDDYLLRIALQSDARVAGNFDRDHSSRTGLMSGIAEDIITSTSNLGIWFKGLGNRAEAKTYRTAAPIVQAYLLMIIVMFLPILMILSGFSFPKIVGLSAMYCSVIFWGYLFAVAHYLDNFMIEALVAGRSDSEGNIRSLANFVAGGGGLLDNLSSDAAMSMRIIKWISRMAYVWLPVIFTVLMGMVGYRIASDIGRITQNTAGATASAANRTTESLASGKVR